MTIKRSIVLILWAITYLKINFGVIRNHYFRILLENNQLFLKLLFMGLILILFYREMGVSFKQVKLKGIVAYSLVPAILLLMGEFIYMFLIFDAVEIETYSFSTLFILNSLVIGPVYEELIYRFIFINNTWRFKNKLPPLFLSSLIFAFSHRYTAGGNILLMIPLFVTGIYLGLIFIKTNNILYSVCAHLFLTAVSFFFRLSYRLVYTEKQVYNSTIVN